MKRHRRRINPSNQLSSLANNITIGVNKERGIIKKVNRNGVV